MPNERGERFIAQVDASLFGIPDPVALVTGSGAPRVGNCVARALAARGFRVVLHANRSTEHAEQTATELREAGSDTLVVTADLTNEADVERILNEIERWTGRLDVLVNCASIWERKRLEQVSADDVRRNFEINTLATFLCCQKAGAMMVGQARGGAIVNFGDWSIVRPYVDYPAYFPSKGAIPTLTRSLAVELAARNPRIRVNAILPGPVMMPDDLPAEERQHAIDATLVKREGTPAHVAAAVVFLVENDFVTGICVPVDGGRSVYTP